MIAGGSLRGTLVLGAAILLASCSQEKTGPTTTASAAAAASAPHAVETVAWRKPEGASTDAVFAIAREINKPVFLYWGAVWCPPCNQVKRTVFQRPDFIAVSRKFVPVYVDGDAPGAQQIGERFHVRGYPTMIVLRPDQTEITRLPGEVDAARYLEALDLALNATSSVKSLLQSAQSGAALDAAAWRRLAYYAWEQDAAQVLPAKNSATVLWDVAQRCPSNIQDLRLRLLTRAASRSEQDHKPIASSQSMLLLDGLQTVLTQPTLTRELMDVLSNDVDTLYAALKSSKSPSRDTLVRGWQQQLQVWSRDTTLGAADRLSAMAAWVHLARLEAPSTEKDKAQPPPPWVTETIGAIAAQVSDSHERQAVIPAAADLLSEIGRVEDSNSLLQSELPRAVAPYYHMLMLSNNARKQGNTGAALDWAERAWKASLGPATRLQWGTSYMSRLIDLAPQDEGRIAQTLQTLLQEVDIVPENFVHRNAKQMERLGGALQRWSAHKPQRVKALQAAKTEWEKRCAGLPAGNPTLATCRGVFAPSKVRET